MPWICSNWQVNWTAIAACIALTVFVVDVVRRWFERRISAQLMAVAATPELWEARALLKDALELLAPATRLTLQHYQQVRQLIDGASLTDLDKLRENAGALPIGSARAFVYGVRNFVQLQRIIRHPNFYAKVAAAQPTDQIWEVLRTTIEEALKYIERAALATWKAAKFRESPPL